MKIPDFHSDRLETVQQTLLRSLETSSRNREVSSDSQDSIEISSFSETLLQTMDRSSRVEALRANYESGGYQVNPEALAKNLISSHLSGLESTPGNRVKTDGAAPTAKGSPERTPDS